MIKRILIIGGYGNFGRFITKELVKNPDIQVIIAGRNRTKAKKLAESVKSINPPQTIYLDIYKNLSEVLSQTNANVVIHTSGPYQSQSYFVAKTCIAYKCHYIDLADARQFVANIGILDERAKANGVLITSGASSVPTLTSAIIDCYISKFSQLDEIDCAISSAQKTNQGLATTQAILSYVGKPFKTLINGKMTNVYGWQGLRIKKLWGLSYRCSGNCDVPDLELFPSRYPLLKNIRFQAGIESKFQHIGLYLLSWLVRIGLVKSLQPAGKVLLSISRLFDVISTNDSGFYMDLKGLSNDSNPQTISFQIVARNGDGLYIPCIPSILIAKKLVRNELSDIGAHPCMGYISLDEYLDALKLLNIKYKITHRPF